MTPWQKENLKYLQEKGNQPAWSSPASEETEDMKEAHEDEEELAEEALFEAEQAIEETDAGKEELPEPEKKARSFADRLPNLKAYRNQVLIRRLALIIGLLMIPLLIVLYFVSPLSRLANVVVKGNQEVSAEAILENSDLAVNEEMWPQFFERNQSVAAIKKELPRIKNASISLSGINRFDITVTEFQEVALLAKDGGYAPVLENGAVLDDISEQPEEGLPVLENFSAEDKIKATLSAYQELSSEIRDGISQIKYTPRDSNDELLTLFMNDGNQVIVNISNMVSQMQYYPQIAKDLTEDSIVDMEVGIFTYPISNTQEDDADENQTADSDS
ncbi:cell division protein FtsQ [Enterococcus casseliflavus]|uniref:cell division protein FtsQ/DivIB n=1 Tax=Enterococcus casseliflavus TaxID=37734 RepID=UPI000E06B9B5|nr:cell division protein FtsQ/DivIB [Enterococcus casseliflavus]GEB28055.1 cell division protein DivIB [Enterococcus casseliflavus]STP36452.1 cell division protein FtsQ [Enterococcus casseliflavus]